MVLSAEIPFSTFMKSENILRKGLRIQTLFMKSSHIFETVSVLSYFTFS